MKKYVLIIMSLTFTSLTLGAEGASQSKGCYEGGFGKYVAETFKYTDFSTNTIKKADAASITVNQVNKDANKSDVIYNTTVDENTFSATQTVVCDEGKLDGTFSVYMTPKDIIENVLIPLERINPQNEMAKKTIYNELVAKADSEGKVKVGSGECYVEKRVGCVHSIDMRSILSKEIFGSIFKDIKYVAHSEQLEEGSSRFKMNWYENDRDSEEMGALFTLKTVVEAIYGPETSTDGGSSSSSGQVGN